METGFSDIHPDIIEAHLLPRLDGCQLATVGCVSATLRSLSASPDLWSRIRRDTWPSTNTPRLQQVVSEFPSGPLSFFSQAFPLLRQDESAPASKPFGPPPDHAPLISAVDFFYKSEPILSKTQETETGTGWFRSSPFRIDLLDTKEVVPSPVLETDACQSLFRDLTLSWIVIDPVGRRAVNVSSMNPVSVHRHWLTGEVQAKFATVMGDALCAVEVTWAGVEGEEGRLAVREVGLEVEDVDGIRLSGRESVEILQGAMESRRRAAVRGGDGDGGGMRRRYEGFMERRRERSERRKREEGAWDVLYLAMAVFMSLALFLGFFL